jgi:hypothetical protein
MSSKKRAFATVLLAFALTLVVGAVPSAACSSGGGDAWLVFHGDGTAWLIFHRVQLRAEVAMEICIIGVNELPGVVAVDSAGFVDTKTGEPFNALTFQPSQPVGELLQKVSPVLGREIEGLPKVTSWRGFIGFVDGEIPAGQEVDLMFDLRLDPSVSKAEIARSLNSVGLFAMGALTDEGLPVEDHFSIRRPMEIGVMDDSKKPSPANR